MGTHDELMKNWGQVYRQIAFVTAFKGGTGIMENRNNRGGMRGPGMGRRPAEKIKRF